MEALVMMNVDGDDLWYYVYFNMGVTWWWSSLMEAPDVTNADGDVILYVWVTWWWSSLMEAPDVTNADGDVIFYVGVTWWWSSLMEAPDVTNVYGDDLWVYVIFYMGVTWWWSSVMVMMVYMRWPDDPRCMLVLMVLMCLLDMDDGQMIYVLYYLMGVDLMVVLTKTRWWYRRVIYCGRTLTRWYGNQHLKTRL